METATLRARWSSLLGEDPADSQRDPGHTVESRRLRLLECLADQPSPAPQPQSDAFALIEPLGEGGMGLVYRAREHRLRREVALKMLKAGSGAGAQELFLAEAVLSGNLDHPNIVPVHFLGNLPNGDPFLTMKLVEGETWQARLRGDTEAALPEQLEILLQVSNAVAFAHNRGIVHNDLKPANVMLGPYGEVLVVDWGLAVSFWERAPAGFRKNVDIQSPCGTPLRHEPQHAEARANRARLRLRRGDKEGSLADARELIKLAPDDAQGHAAAARALSQLGRADEALAACLRAHELDVHDVDNLELRAYLYGMRGAYQRAIEDCSEALRLDPRRANAFAIRSNCRNALGQHQAALADADQALALQPDLADAWYYRAHARALLGQHREAIADYEAALAAGCRIEDILIQVALHWCELEAGDSALEALSRHIALYPEQAYGYLLRAEILGLLGRVQESLRDLGCAIERDPGEPTARMMRAQLLWGQGQLQAALQDLEQVGGAVPEAPLMAAALCGQLAAAAPEAEAAALLDAGFAWLARAEQAGTLEPAGLQRPELSPLRADPRWQQLLERLAGREH